VGTAEAADEGGGGRARRMNVVHNKMTLHVAFRAGRKKWEVSALVWKKRQNFPVSSGVEGKWRRGAVNVGRYICLNNR
jgi:hypothetical protein